MDTTAVQLELMGRFSVTVDGTIRTPRWPGRRAEELVQLLALAPEHRLAREQVIDALWPHLDAEAGAANLRKAAHFARQGLADPEAVALRGGHVLLYPDATVSTDVERFELAALAAVTDDDAAAARAAARLYSGELLPSARYEDWAEPTRRRLHERFVALLRRGAEWERLAEVEPTDEEAARALMRAALAAGNRHGALARYHRVRAALERELGVLPDAETEAVHRLCLQGLERVGQPEFVGRAPELAAIAARLRAPGRAAVVIVRGPLGIGKSALVHQVGLDASREGWHVVPVAASDPAAPYATLVAAAEHVVHQRRDLLEGLGDTTRTVLAELSPLVPAAGSLTMPLTRHQVIGAVHRLFTAAAGPAGLLLVVDDAHLADAATIDSLLHLGASGRVPITVLCAYRPEAAPDPLRRGVSRLAHAPWALTVDLGPLDRAELERLLGAALREDRPDHSTLGELVALAEGSPLLALELARRHRAGTVRDGDLASRLVDLDETAMSSLRRVALGGAEFDLAAVIALAGTTEAEASTVLDAGLAAGALEVMDGRYRFRHELVRAALAEELPPHQRVTVHRDAAARLAATGAPPTVVARHWMAGERPKEALPWLLAAARDSMRLSAYRTALEHLDTLLQTEPAHPEALLLRARALDALGDIRALSAYAAAVEVAGPAERAEIIPHQALAQIKLGDPPGALVTLGDVRPVGLHARLARALTLSGAAALGFGDPAVGSAEAAEGRRLAFASGDAAAITVASWAQAAAAHARGEQRANLLADLMDTHALPTLATTVFDGQLCINQRLLYGARPYPDVIAWADSFAAEARRLGAERGVAFAITLRGEASLLAGDLDQADIDLREAWRLHRAMNGTTGEAFSLQRRAEVALERGRVGEAHDLLDEALDVARESDVGFHLLDRIYGTRISLAMATEPESVLAALDEAEAAVQGPVETCPGCRITMAFPAALAAAHAHDAERLAVYEQSVDFLANIVMRLPAWDAALLEVRAHQRLLAGDRDGALDQFAAAARRYEAAGQPVDVRRCEALLSR